MILHVVLLAAAVGRVHQDDIKLIIHRVVEHIMKQGILMEHARHIQPMQQQVGDAEHVRELLLLDAVYGLAVLLLVRCVFHLLVQLFEPAGDETARAASKVRHRFADLRPDRLRHEISDGARRIEFAGGTGTLQLFEDGFIDVAEGVALLVVAQIQLVDDVDDLTQQHAVLHVVVGIGERRLHDGLLDRR